MTDRRRNSEDHWIRRACCGAAAALAVIVLQPSAALGAPPKPIPNKSVTTIIEDADVNGAFTIASDGGGAYQDGVGGVSSILTANVCNGLTYGDWRLNVQTPSRSVMEGFFDPEDRVLGFGPWTPPYVGYQSQKSWINVQCTCSQNQSIYVMTKNQAPIVCPLINSWNDADGDLWRFSAFGGPNYPETTKAQISCLNDTTDSQGTHCVEWAIEPIGGSGNEAIGRAVETPSHGKPTEASHGSYYMRFRIHVSLP